MSLGGRRMSPTKEDYLKSIAQLEGINNIVSNKSLANALNIKAGSVTEMIGRLVKDDLVTYIPYKGVQLTAFGKEKAGQLIRKHRLWEVFLVNTLGFDWDEVHKEADRLEHASSDELMDRLDEFLGFPETDPHGAFIPGKDGKINRTHYIPLSELNAGETFTFKQVEDDEELLSFLTDNHFAINQNYEVIEKNDSADKLVVALDDGADLTIPHSKTDRIFVETV